MKNVILVACAIITLCSCGKSNEDKARELIESQLKTTMKDWSSYEFVEMSKLDSARTTYLSTPEYKNLYNERSGLESKKNEFNIKSDYPDSYGKERCKEMSDSIEIITNRIAEIENEINQEENNFKSEFDGWYVDFTFRGNNSLGGKTISKSRYIFNKEITEIENAINLD